MKFVSSGDNALIIELDDVISAKINYQIKQIKQKLLKLDLDFINEILPTYRSLMIYYDCFKISFEELKKLIKKECKFNFDAKTKILKEFIEIPLCYGGEFGEDLEFIAKHNNLSIQEVINIHSKNEYLIYMLGFTPGFPYLGGMDKSIATPRLKNPRLKIPAGSVGIAGEQTGVYPIESPGGWQLLGRTPLKLFDLNQENPFLLGAGKYIKFKAIEKNEYQALEKQVKENTFNPKTYTKEANLEDL